MFSNSVIFFEGISKEKQPTMKTRWHLHLLLSPLPVATLAPHHTVVANLCLLLSHRLQAGPVVVLQIMASLKRLLQHQAMAPILQAMAPILQATPALLQLPPPHLQLLPLQAMARLQVLQQIQAQALLQHHLGKSQHLK